MRRSGVQSSLDSSLKAYESILGPMIALEDANRSS